MTEPNRKSVRCEPKSTASVHLWHALTTDEILGILSAREETGLSSDDAVNRLARFGPNALPEQKSPSIVWIFLAQFNSPLIYLLFLAAAVALSLGHTSDSLVILAIVSINAVIGAFQEGRAQESIEALRKLSATKVQVLRDGLTIVVDARSLVPGDILVLAGGDAIAADARIIEAKAIEVSESALTGESVPVPKDISILPPDTILADRSNMVFSGTHITAGRGRAVVVATGVETEVGKIAILTAEAEVPKTPLEQRIAQFGRYVILAASVIFTLVMAIGLMQGRPFSEILMIAISQTVSVIPEGLPVAMTVALAVGMQRMARCGAIVRRLAAVETLGSTNVICSDKTGTLTRNEMTVSSVYLPEDRMVRISGSGYEPQGTFAQNGTEIDPSKDQPLRELLLCGALCNDARLVRPDDTAPNWRVLGDPTEGSLLTLALKGGVSVDDTRRKFSRLAEIPFDSATKMMAVQVRDENRVHIFLKGAPEAVLDLVADKQLTDRTHAACEDMAQQALRLLAFATTDDVDLDLSKGFEALHKRVRLLGIVGQFDPPRDEAREAVARCRDAGILPVMVTGDHKLTGLAVARILGIAREGDIAIDGKELAELSEIELQNRLEKISVYARVHPAQKLRIVDAWQSRKAVVAMTGDGVNDAPALAKADVGVAMGITGTEVAKEASSIVITDDNFATIVRAVQEGRLVYLNLKKLILYLVSTGIAEVVVLFAALLFGYPLPLAAVQILWVNLVADGTMTLPLVLDPAEGEEMRRAPIPRGESILTSKMLKRMSLMVAAMACSTFGYFAYRLQLGIPLEQVQTETFTVLAVCQWFNALNCRSDRRSAFKGLLTNPWILGGLIVGNLLHIAVVFAPPLNRIFHTVPLPIGEVVLIGLTASLVLWVEEFRKFWFRRQDSVAGPQN